MNKEKYVFFYYWNLGNPRPAKAIVGISGDNSIPGAKWEITEDQFNNMSLFELTGEHPWPFPEGNDEEGEEDV